ncbi:type II pantothenate kinase [Mesobacillus selenatarsenatis]|uniref:Pantothenate kinase type II, eukaryotic n=1 Tax=Mesobacillus selenatarsenatis (strain DSM 18680 / JCM 14380 / FERM P-15431 / SF-1) TaxID=1321606 RepID=A0A0A8X298_MESS1|nr:type II pantothenate kinase [Mesobacillus selenatarsenatis]GAM13359.1 pantothenate kinase type II, eukaryotic [Mesobacillus selenatarsenatis SF-1]
MYNMIGIDAGGSLIKIAYEENGRLNFRKQPIGEMDDVLGWLKLVSSNKRVSLTGGRAGKIKAEFFPESEIIDEFTAAFKGANYLMMKEGLPSVGKYLLINIGTGTSWFKIEGEHYDRVLGSGIGGGTFMGMGNLLAEPSDFTSLVSLSAAGEKGNVDLLVKDIYHPEEPPIPGDLTASNFAKTEAISSSSAADKVSSVLNMIAETITLLTVQTAALHNTKRVIFIGSTLAGNKPLQECLDFYCKMSGLEPTFLQNGEFSGAIGALLK